ncbi:GNAT family N-acetyltransferase [Dictyobacter kobayashii]|uniref:N-acetyltransferase n=1 Tax=Dictyobacter kobayashii TaxID=2014872 RepID=A0A402AVA9_9CHLR|nr:GNAT family protein [Dictyobacter kobayashii]GCE23071.1 N-acetyltransferase [Dictyobacter kobayashii]
MKVFIAGENVLLRPLEMDDLEVFWAWFADREVTKYSMGTWLFPWSKYETELWLKRTIQDRESLTLGVVEKEAGPLLGYAGITSISHINRSSEYYIFLGAKSSWGKGYGTEVTRLMVDYGFASLNLHRIMLTVSAPNIGGVKAYTKAGFQQEGILHQACYRDGAYHDKIIMAILYPEWAANRSP